MEKTIPLYKKIKRKIKLQKIRKKIPKPSYLLAGGVGAIILGRYTYQYFKEHPEVKNNAIKKLTHLNLWKTIIFPKESDLNEFASSESHHGSQKGFEENPELKNSHQSEEIKNQEIIRELEN